MGLVDSFAAEDRVSVKISDFYKLMKESAKSDLIMNAVNCDVPHQYIREMATGSREVLLSEPGIQVETDAGAQGLVSAT